MSALSLALARLSLSNWSFKWRFM